jgi:hypothetical protein
VAELDPGLAGHILAQIPVQLAHPDQQEDQFII